MVGPAPPGFSLRNCILHLKPVSQNPSLFPQSVMLDHKKDFEPFYLCHNGHHLQIRWDKEHLEICHRYVRNQCSVCGAQGLMKFIAIVCTLTCSICCTTIINFQRASGATWQLRRYSPSSGLRSISPETFKGMAP